MLKPALILCLAAAGFGQQKATYTEQSFVMFENTMLAVRYTPPAPMKGRKIFGGVVPYGQVWKIGDATPVTIHAEADVQFNGFSLFKGDYSVYVLPEADSWQLIINKQTGAKALEYDQKLDMGRVKMTVSKAPAPVETCKITITKTADLAGKIELAWENTVATVPFYLDRAAVDTEW
jgi:hypothetical protein